MEKPLKTVELPPEPCVLIESLRGMGYSLPSAIADIVDNSISAEACQVNIEFKRNGAHLRYISILDDGVGMSEGNLLKAMRLGSSNPSEFRKKNDMGRFGMGLKTASFSQCRCVTVFSKTVDGKISLKRWDLDYLSDRENNGRWSLLLEPGNEAKMLVGLLDTIPHGTLVVWETLDRLEIPSETVYYELLRTVEDHIARTFHRLLEENSQLHIYFNGNLVRPQNPFLPDQGATLELPQDRFPEPNGIVVVQGYVLPRQDMLQGADPQRIYDEAGGSGGWASNEGFYIYRNKRLIKAGGWLGLGSNGKKWTNEEEFKLARIKVDIPNSMDSDWKIDIKKSNVFPPTKLKEKLRDIAQDIRRKAKERMLGREKYKPRNPVEECPVWLEIKRKTRPSIFRINREHPGIKQLLKENPMSSKDKEKILKLIEDKAPIRWDYGS